MKKYIFVLVVLLGPLSINAQRDKNITACFSQLLVDKVDFTENTKLKYALYSLWNSQLYDSAKQSGALNATGYGDLNYDQSHLKTLNELQVHEENIDYDRATALHTAMLDPQAGGIIKSCLASLSSKYGAWAYVEVEDERFIHVVVHWTSTDGLPLKIRSQSITGGAVVDDGGTHPSLPIPQDTGFFARFFDPDISSGSSKSFRIQRDNPYATVSVKFNLSPGISLDDDLPPMPPVPEKLHYRTVVHSGEPGLAHTFLHGLGGNGSWVLTDKITDLTADPTAVFTSVLCNKVANGPHTRLERATPEWWGINVQGLGVGTREASCSGFTDEFQGTTIGIAVQYQVTGLVADKVPWKWVDWNKKH